MSEQLGDNIVRLDKRQEQRRVQGGINKTLGVLDEVLRYPDRLDPPLTNNQTFGFNRIKADLKELSRTVAQGHYDQAVELQIQNSNTELRNLGFLKLLSSEQHWKLGWDS